MSSISKLVRDLSSEDSLDLLPTVLIIVLVTCIFISIVWMIISLIRKRSSSRFLLRQREQAAAEFFSNENLRILQDVYTPSGESLGKLASYYPILYGVKIEPLNLKKGVIKPLGIESVESNSWVHILAIKPFYSQLKNDELIFKTGITSGLKFATLLSSSQTPVNTK